jgi:predicted ArsR family transcriptional regulator
LIEEATITDLAEVVGLKAISVRHHINALLADGLIRVEERRQAVGRPVYVFRLSEAGRRAAGFSYRSFVEQTMRQLGTATTAESHRAVIQSLTTAIEENVRREFSSLLPHQRMPRLIDWLTSAGFAARWQEIDQGLGLIEYHCPYSMLGQTYPDLCAIDKSVIQIALDAPVEKSSCLLSGDDVCTFLLRVPEDKVQSAGDFR